MHGNSLFNIINAANGYIVIVNKPHYGYPSPVPVITPEMIDRITDNMKGSDDIMNKLKQQEHQEPALNDLKEDNVHIFKKWDEVLAFLKYIME